MKAFLAFLFAVSVLAWAVVPVVPVRAAVCTAQQTQYVVKPGDTLYRIGLAHGVLWPEIAAVNQLANPNLIFTGQVLCIPRPAPSPTVTAIAAATATRTPTPTATRTPAPPAATTTPIPGFTVPTFSIVSVVRDTSVTIRTANFPPNQDFDVLMGRIGTRGVGGTRVTTTASGAGGSFTATYTVPVGLRGQALIAIRLESPQGYFSYNWFYNNTTP